MNRRKIILNKTEKRDSRWHDYKEEWINKWNIICVKLVAIISFVVIISVIVVKSVNFEPKEENDSTGVPDVPDNDSKALLTRNIQKIAQLNIDEAVPANDCTFSLCSYWGTERCCFHCFQISSKILTETIKKRYEENTCTSPTIILILDQVTFEDKILKENWWNLNYYVTHIFFKSCDLKEIENNALGIHFSGTITISFIRSQIAYYRKKMFKYMSFLVDFEIRDSNLASNPVQFKGSNPEGIKFEFGMLGTFKNSLTTLQVQGSIIDPVAIRNLTGIELNALQIIDFRYNTKLTYIPDDVFRTPILKQLFISDNGLEKIHKDAFKNSINVEQIFLERNNLETLDRIIFSSFSPLAKVYISGNKWACNCNLQFLASFAPDLSKTECVDGKLLPEFFKICSSNCSLTTSVVTTTTTIETTTGSATKTTSTETTTTRSATTKSDSKTPARTTLITNPVEKPCRIISNKFHVIEQNGETEISYNDITQPNDQFTLLSSHDSYCSFKNGRGYINKTNTAFILCRKNSEDLDCYSGVTPAEYAQQAWLKNSEKLPAILIITAISIIACVLSGFIAYYCIRAHPKLLRGSKRIAFVETPAPEVVVLPPKPRTPVYLMPYPDPDYNHSVSYIPVRDPNYLTPISQRYMQVKEKYERPPLKRSVSDLSLKTVASYVTENQILSSRRQNYGERSPVRRCFDEPPPLPPPRNRFSGVSEGDFRNRHFYSHFW